MYHTLEPCSVANAADERLRLCSNVSDLTPKNVWGDVVLVRKNDVDRIKLSTNLFHFKNGITATDSHEALFTTAELLPRFFMTASAPIFRIR